MTAETIAPASAAARVSPIAHVHDQPRHSALVAVARRYAVVAAVALILAAVHIRHRPATLCLFREVTGLPCPFCGGTTAAVNLGHGDLGGALRASPLAVGLLAFGPLLSGIRRPQWWQLRRVRWITIGSVLAASEVWELVRFGFIHVSSLH